MGFLIETSSPLEVASLWRLNLLPSDEVVRVCQRWLEEDCDQGDPDIAWLAGETGPIMSDVAPVFDRVLASIVKQPVERDEAILRVLLLHINRALQGSLMEGAQQVVHYAYQVLPEHRLVHHPRRLTDNPDGVFAMQNLGLEYAYGSFYAFDDIGYLFGEELAAAEAELFGRLRTDLRELRDHLTNALDEGSKATACAPIQATRE